MLAVPSSSGVLECSALLSSFVEKLCAHGAFTILIRSPECDCDHTDLLQNMKNRLDTGRQQSLSHLISTITHASADSTRQRWFEAFACHSDGIFDIHLVKMCTATGALCHACAHRRSPISSVRIAGLVGHIFVAFVSVFPALPIGKLSCLAYRLVAAYVDNHFTPSAWTQLDAVVHGHPVPPSHVREYDYITEQVGAGRVPCQNMRSVAPALSAYLWNASCSPFCNSRAFLQSASTTTEPEPAPRTSAPPQTPHQTTGNVTESAMRVSDSDVSILQKML